MWGSTKTSFSLSAYTLIPEVQERSLGCARDDDAGAIPVTSHQSLLIPNPSSPATNPCFQISGRMKKSGEIISSRWFKKHPIQEKNLIKPIYSYKKRKSNAINDFNVIDRSGYRYMQEKIRGCAFLWLKSEERRLANIHIFSRSMNWNFPWT